jgi:basic membrane protein A
MLKKSFALLVLASVLLAAGPASAEAGKLKVGIVFDKGGKDDKSFNAAAFRGLKEAQDKLGIEAKWVEASDDNVFEPTLKQFARKDFDLIFGVGFSQAQAIKKVAAEFPKKSFVIVDAQVDMPNVRSLLFAEHEGSFIVGAIAALKSKSGKVGFIGGMDVPLIRRFELGYKAGAEHINKNVQLVSNYVGVTPDAWNNPPKAKELALSQFTGGVDVSFAAAGASGVGLLDAAEEMSARAKAEAPKYLAIGCDSNQNWIKPGFVLTSMLKKVDVAVFKTIEDAKAGKFTAGLMDFSLANNGVDYALDEHNDKLMTPEIRQKIDQLKADIVAGKIAVPDYYKKNGKI